LGSGSPIDVGRTTRRDKKALTPIHGGHGGNVPAANVPVERVGTVGVTLEGNGELTK
jgi:hypothetical protein